MLSLSHSQLLDKTIALKLASGKITDPVEYLDFELPAEYSVFKMLFADVSFSVSEEALVFDFSSDGGATFTTSPAFNSYVRSGYANGTPDVINFGEELSALGNTTYDMLSGPPNLIDITIMPGGVGSNAAIFAQAGISRPGGFYVCSTLMAVFFTITGRQNLIRFQPYGEGTSSPPTSGETFTAGSYILWGIAP